MFPVLPVANVANVQSRIGNWNWQHFHIGNILTLATFIVGLIFAPCARAENAYTNHAGNVVSGVVVARDARTTTISNEVEVAALPLSIFPTNEQRRIAADFVLRQGGAGGIDILRVPAEVKRAVHGAEKAMARSRKRAEKGLCSKEKSDAFCAESEAALGSYLDRQVESGAITPAERTALGH